MLAPSMHWRLVAVICACFAARGLFYATATPLWEGHDEYAAIAWLDAAGGRLLPAPEAPASRELEASLRMAPLPRQLTPLVPAAIAHDEFWQLTPAQRNLRIRDLAAIPAAWRTEPGDSPLISGARRAPLYYWLMAPVESLAGKRQIVSRVFLLRALNVVIATTAIPFAYVLALTVFGDVAAALCATIALAAMPQEMMGIAHAGPEALALVAATLIALGAVRVATLREAAVFGALLGVAWLVEVRFVVFLAIPVFLLYHRWKELAATLAAALFVAGWWYALRPASAPVPPAFGFVEALTRLDWVRAADFSWFTFVWAGNDSFLNLRSWVYRLSVLVALVVIFGLSRRGGVLRPGVWALIGLHLAMGLYIIYEGVVNVRTGGMPVTPGWLAAALSASTAVLAVYGLRSLASSSIAVPALLFATLDLYGVHVVLMPYYAGFISFSSTGHLAAFPLARWSYLVFDRLAVNKPAWIDSTTLSALWAGYAVGTITLISLAAWIARAARRTGKESEPR